MVSTSPTIQLSAFAGPQGGFRLGNKVTGTDYAEWVAMSAMFSVLAHSCSCFFLTFVIRYARPVRAGGGRL